MLIENIDNKNIKGHVCVSLLEDGKIVKQVEKDNFISLTGKEFLKLKQVNAIAERIGGNANINRFAQFLNSPFSRVVLTDSAVAGNELTDIFLDGNVIGYADKDNTYIGSDTKRGTVNLAESYVDKSKIHFAFDFPTHCANGTIQTLGFRSIEDNAFRMVKDSDGEGGYLFCNTNKDRVGYLTDRSSSRNILEFNLDNLTFVGKQLSKFVRGIANLDNKLYILGDADSNNAKIYDFSTGDFGAEFVLSKDVPVKRCVCGYKNKLYVSSASSSVDPDVSDAYSKYLYVFNSLGVFEKRILMPKPAVGAHQILSPFSENVLYVFVEGSGSYLLDLKIDSFKVFRLEPGLNSYEILTKFVFDEDLNKRYSIFRKDSYAWGLYELTGSLGSKIVLPEPIVKTNAHTLKIEYDFIY